MLNELYTIFDGLVETHGVYKVEFHSRFRKVGVREHKKGNSNYYGARPVHQIISMMKLIVTSRLSTKKTLSTPASERRGDDFKGFEHINLKAKAIIWPGLSYMLHIRSRADHV